MAVLLVFGSILIMVLILPRIVRLICKDELPEPYPVSICVVVGIAFAIAGFSMLLKPETPSAVLLGLIFLLVSAGLFIFVGLIVKGVIYLKFGYFVGSSSRSKYKIVLRREHQQKALRIFIIFCCLVFSLMLFTAILRQKGL